MRWRWPEYGAVKVRNREGSPMRLERIETARPLAGYRIRLRFADGTEGVADLSSLVSHGGVFAALAADFGALRIIEHGRALAWHDAEGDDVDLCADALHQLLRKDRAAAE